MLAEPVALTQNDIRELQLAKAAVAAGIKLLMQRRGAKQLSRLYLAGAFGNYIDRASAQRIGLIDFPPDRVEAAGNTALLGAKLALFSHDSEGGSYPGLRRHIEHVALNADPCFQDVFVEELAFPPRSTADLREAGPQATGVKGSAPPPLGQRMPGRKRGFSPAADRRRYVGGFSP